MNSKEKIANKDVAEESKCDFSKEIAPKIMKDTIDDDYHKYEETRDEDSCRVKDAAK